METIATTLPSTVLMPLGCEGEEKLDGDAQMIWQRTGLSKDTIRRAEKFEGRRQQWDPIKIEFRHLSAASRLFLQTNTGGLSSQNFGKILWNFVDAWHDY